MNTETTTASHDFYTIADSCLLSPYNIDTTGLQQVFGQILTHEIDYADLYFQYNRSEGWMLEEGIVKSGSFNIDQGVGVRAISGDKTAFAYSDDISMPALESAAKATRAIASQGGGQSVKVNKSTEIEKNSLLYLPEDPIASLRDSEKVALLEKLEKYARKLDARVIQVMASLAGEYEVILVTRSDGVLAADVRPLVRLSLQVITEENGRREQGVAGGGGRFDYTYFTDEILRDYASKAVHQAVINLEARPAPAGTMTVVLGNGWPGILLHEAIGHGLEGDFNRKGSSAFSGRVGQRVAAPGVTVVDDGTIKCRRGSLNIDDEGNPTQCTTLIEDGILKAYMQDSLNARLMNLPVTGNGRRESFAHIPMPRMTNTYMHNGDKEPEEIIASVKDGLYAANFGGGQVDITSGKFVFSAAEAYRIENGKITYPVKGATLIGNGPDVLTRVSMIGNDMALDPGVGTCGKDGQSVPVGVGQPTLRIDGLTVGGTGN
ncbi:microcin-processing peptidase 2. Unknown type peptidase. MEROPS family U62 [Nitrosomonas aestuarii]|uniref:TldD protein n=1 Tax=Nitrosomonas aestuarii TaxID=52441 RepID=A0A1I3YQE4_9PROT|nr:metalloprotease TldD [Nitrosomonas aestuarii]SFK34015.1 microcin-processing peptidase 2. Unknown type peptidase. MEROPS family U62 [Nitrosomonas aestuarii]